MLSDCCPVLSVTLMYCGQMVEQIKIKLGMMVGLGFSHIVLGGDPAPVTERGTAAPTACVHMIRGPCLLWPIG